MPRPKIIDDEKIREMYQEGYSSAEIHKILNVGHGSISRAIGRHPKISRRKYHGMSKTKVYGIWIMMRDRCYNPQSTCFSYYGGRGISVCDRWRNSFENFINDMGMPPAGYTLDRINNDGEYGPENCRWATRKTQSRNSSQTKWITHNGETLCMSDWCARIGIGRATLTARLKRGIPVGQALTMLPRARCVTKND